MTEQIDEKGIGARMKTPLYKAANRTAVIAGVFAIIVLGLLIINYLQIKFLLAFVSLECLLSHYEQYREKKGNPLVISSIKKKKNQYSKY